MQVVHVIVGLGIGGAELMLRRLVMAQGRSTVVSMTEVGPVGRMLQDAGIEVVALGMRGAQDLPITFVKLVRLIKARQPDVVQTWMVHADLLGGLAARLVGIRAVIWGIRTTEFSGASRSTRLIRWLCARLSHRIPAAIACAADASRRSHEAIGYDPSRMVVIPNGFDVERFRPDAERRRQVRAGLGIDARTVVVGHLGRWNHAKDHTNFVRAAALLQWRGWPPDNPHALAFVMAGRDVDDDNEKLGYEIANSGCPGRFRLLGERNDIPELIQAFDLFCLSSRTEGFPNVVGEAMACGVPCVVTDVGDAALLIGGTGWVVPKEDPTALCGALSRALSESAEARQQRAVAARQRIVKEFSMERACGRFADLQKAVWHRAEQRG